VQPFGFSTWYATGSGTAGGTTTPNPLPVPTPIPVPTPTPTPTPTPNPTPTPTPTPNPTPTPTPTYSPSLQNQHPPNSESWAKFLPPDAGRWHKTITKQVFLYTNGTVTIRPDGAVIWQGFNSYHPTLLNPTLTEVYQTAVLGYSLVRDQIYGEGFTLEPDRHSPERYYDNKVIALDGSGADYLASYISEFRRGLNIKLDDEVDRDPRSAEEVLIGVEGWGSSNKNGFKAGLTTPYSSLVEGTSHHSNEIDWDNYGAIATLYFDSLDKVVHSKAIESMSFDQKMLAGIINKSPDLSDAIQRLSKTYKNLFSKEIEKSVTDQSLFPFLNTFQHASVSDDILDGAQQLDDFLTGDDPSIIQDPNDSVNLIDFTEGLIKATKKAPGLDNIIERPGFMKNLVELGRLYVSLKPSELADPNADDPKSFLYTLWQSQDDAAIEKAATELSNFMKKEDGSFFSPPEELLKYEFTLLKAMKVNPDLADECKDLALLSALIDFGKTYLDIVGAGKPSMTTNVAEESSEFFLDILLQAKNDLSLTGAEKKLLIAQAGRNLKEFFSGFSTNKSRTDLIRFEQGLFKVLQKSTVLAQEPKSATLLKSMASLGRAYAVLSPSTHSQPEPEFFLQTIWKSQDDPSIAKAKLELERFIGDAQDVNSLMVNWSDILDILLRHPKIPRYNEPQFLYGALAIYRLGSDAKVLKIGSIVDASVNKGLRLVCERAAELGITGEQWDILLDDPYNYPNEVWEYFGPENSVIFDRYFGRDGRRTQPLNFADIAIGNGRTLLDQYRASSDVQSSVESLREAVGREISIQAALREKLSLMSLVGTRFTGVVGDDVGEENRVVSGIFALGSSPLFVRYTATITSDAGVSRNEQDFVTGYSYNLILSFDGSDWFVDAADLCDETPTDFYNIYDSENNEEFLGGKPFYMELRWDERWSTQTRPFSLLAD
jgi:hypothetical protein